MKLLLITFLFGWMLCLTTSGQKKIKIITRTQMAVNHIDSIAKKIAADTNIQLVTLNSVEQEIKSTGNTVYSK
ncbi:MAG: hypothetical protein V4685_07770 [Bacteroidota bacterium]